MLSDLAISAASEVEAAGFERCEGKAGPGCLLVSVPEFRDSSNLKAEAVVRFPTPLQSVLTSLQFLL